jgi:hypothetical protein
LLFFASNWLVSLLCSRMRLGENDLWTKKHDTRQHIPHWTTPARAQCFLTRTVSLSCKCANKSQLWHETSRLQGSRLCEQSRKLYQFIRTTVFDRIICTMLLMFTSLLTRTLRKVPVLYRQHKAATSLPFTSQYPRAVLPLVPSRHRGSEQPRSVLLET